MQARCLRYSPVLKQLLRSQPADRLRPVDFRCQLRVTRQVHAARESHPNDANLYHHLLQSQKRSGVYPELPISMQLRGPANDVQLIKHLLIDRFPEPGTLALLGAAGIVATAAARRRRKAS
jgi:hypothetical protein